MSFDLDGIRARFPALASGIAYLDAPGGTQCPQSVIDAIGAYLRESNANLGGAFAASRRSDELVEQAHATAARFLGCRPEETIFGQNMTTLNFALTARWVARSSPATRSSSRASTTTATSRRGSSSPTTSTFVSASSRSTTTRRSTSPTSSAS